MASAVRCRVRSGTGQRGAGSLGIVMSELSTPPAPGLRAPAPREPSLADALAPVVVLIVLLVLTIVLFGTGAADGPLQVALFMSATFAALVALKNGHPIAAIQDAAVGGVSSAMGAIFILLAVGALIGTWNLAGTIPTIVSYGLALLRPAIFFAIIAPTSAQITAMMAKKIAGRSSARP